MRKFLVMYKNCLKFPDVLYAEKTSKLKLNLFATDDKTKVNWQIGFRNFLEHNKVFEDLRNIIVITDGKVIEITKIFQEMIASELINLNQCPNKFISYYEDFQKYDIHNKIACTEYQINPWSTAYENLLSWHLYKNKILKK